MKRRLLIALLVVFVLATGLFLWHEIDYRRASYQGRHIREWAAELSTSYEPGGTNAPAVAFRAMGATAVPTLRSLLYLRDPIYEKAVLKYSRYLPARARIFLFQKLKPGGAIQYRLGAIRALGVLGPDARAALPDLLKTLNDSDNHLRWLAAQTLPLLGPDAITAVIPLLTNSDASVRHAAAYSLGEARTNALPAVPALIRSSLDPNETVRASALSALSRVGFGGVPKALEMAATETNLELQNAAFRALVALRPPPGRVLTSHLMIATNSPEIRQMALMTLYVTRQTNQFALKLIVSGLDDEAETVRETARKILNRLNSTNRSRMFPL